MLHDSPPHVYRVLSKLNNVTKTNKGWKACCPAHDDTKPSLDIDIGENGKVLLFDRSGGCTVDEICAAIGLTTDDLKAGNGYKAPKQSKKPQRVYPTAEAAIAVYGRNEGVWDYHDAAGQHVGSAVRVPIEKNGEPDKEVKPIYRTSDGWAIGAMPAPRPLYQLPELRDAETVVVTEGEKCADLARSVGLRATTSAGGAQAASKSDWSTLAGKTVYILPDNDDSGTKYADQVAKSLLLLSPPARVKIVKLPLKDTGDDIEQWLEQFGDAAEPETIRDEFNRLADATNWHRIEPVFKVMTSAELDEADLRVEYLVDGVLAAGQPGILAGGKKSLKTNIATDLTLSLASGASFLGEFHVPRSVRVAFMSGESGDAVIQETARRIAKEKPWMHLRDYGNAFWSFSLPRLGRPQTKSELIHFISDYALEVLIIDPLYLCMDVGDNGANNLFAMGQKLVELTEVGHETKSTIVLIHHNRKAAQDPYGPPELENIANSGTQEWARQWILLNRSEPYNPDNAGSHKLWLSVGGSAGHSGLWSLNIEEGSRTDEWGRRWEVSMQSASKAIAEKIDAREQEKEQRQAEKAERQIERDTPRITEVLEASPDGVTFSQLRDRSGVRGDRLNAVLASLRDQGRLENCLVTAANKQTYGGLRLISGTHSDASGQLISCPSGPTDTSLTRTDTLI